MGAIQQVLDRVAQASEPHDTALATQVRQAAVTSMDETPWFRTHTRQWLWGMGSDAAALSMMHPHRSQAAFVALMDDGAGLLVSDG